MAAVAAAIVGGLFVSHASRKAADATTQAADVQDESSQSGIDLQTQQLAEAAKVREEQQRQFGVTQENLRPFLEAGTGALSQQQRFLGLKGPEEQRLAFGEFKESPGQKFLRERGQRSLLRGASAIGGLGGGNVRKNLVEFGTGLAQQDFGNFMNQLSSVSGTGQQAAAQTGQFGEALGRAGAQSVAAGQQGASNIANLLATQGQARASGILGAQQERARGQENVFGFLPQLTGGLKTTFPSIFGKPEAG